MFHGVVDVTRVAGKDKLVVVALGGKHPGHVLIRENPVMHVVVDRMPAEEICIDIILKASKRKNRDLLTLLSRVRKICLSSLKAAPPLSLIGNAVDFL